MKGVITTVTERWTFGETSGRGGSVELEVGVVGRGWHLEVVVPVRAGLVPSREVSIVEVDGRLTLEPCDG